MPRIPSMSRAHFPARARCQTPRRRAGCAGGVPDTSALGGVPDALAGGRREGRWWSRVALYFVTRGRVELALDDASLVVRDWGAAPRRGPVGRRQVDTRRGPCWLPPAAEGPVGDRGVPQEVVDLRRCRGRIGAVPQFHDTTSWARTCSSICCSAVAGRCGPTTLPLPKRSVTRWGLALCWNECPLACNSSSAKTAGSSHKARGAAFSSPVPCFRTSISAS